MSFAKVSEVKAGDLLVTDNGFTCIKAGKQVKVEQAEDGLYFKCAHGRHYLSGQIDDLEGMSEEHYIGLTKVQP